MITQSILVAWKFSSLLQSESRLLLSLCLVNLAYSHHHQTTVDLQNISLERFIHLLFGFGKKADSFAQVTTFRYSGA